MHVDRVIGGVGVGAILDGRTTFDGDEVRAVGVGGDQPVGSGTGGPRPGNDGDILQQHPARAAILQDAHAGRSQQFQPVESGCEAIVHDDGVRRAVADRHHVAGRNRQLAREGVVRAPLQVDLDQPVADPLDAARREEIPGARLQGAGAAVHHLEETVIDGGEEFCVVGITGIDFHHDLQGGVVEAGNGSLRERQRVVVDREIADGDVVRAGDQKRRRKRGIDEPRLVAVELEAAELFELKRLFDPVGGVLFQVEDDGGRLAGLARISG